MVFQWLRFASGAKNKFPTTTARIHLLSRLEMMGTISSMMFIRCLGFDSVVVLLVVAAFAQESYDQLLHQWDYNKSTPLNIKQAGIEERDGITIYDISFSSPVGERSKAGGPNGGTVTAYLIVPPGQGRRFSAVIYGHWCMPGSEKKNRTEILDEAMVLAHSGVISLLPDHVTVHPGFVEDSRPLNEQQIAVEVQQDVNLRRGADLLLARKDVDPRRLAYVGHSCDGSAGGFRSGVEKRFKAFVIMAGDLSFDIDKKTKAFQEYRQKTGADQFDAFAAKYSWMDAGKYVSHAAPAAMFLQYATDEPFLNGELAKQYFELVSEPKKLKIYDAPHALNAEATRDRIAFISEQLSFKPPDGQTIVAIPALGQPPWPKPPK
jgi:dienelactone hydrolase